MKLLGALALAVQCLAACSAQALPPFLGPGARISATHPKNCPAGTVWYSAEEWWRRELAPVPPAAKDFGHVHNELCWPHLATLSGPTVLQITSLAHQNPGRFVRLGVQSVDGTLRAPGQVGDGCPPDENDEHGVSLACRNVRPANRTAWRCVETGGTIAQASVNPATTPPTCKWADTLTISPGTLTASGLVRLRTRVIIQQPSDVVRPPSGLRHGRALFVGPVLMQNGGAPSGANPQDPDQNEMRGTGWGTGTNYTSASLWGPPRLPLGGLWRPWVRMDRGSATSVPVSRHQALLDANFHADDPGIVLRNATGAYAGQLLIDTATLTAGWHKLTVQGKAVDPATGATNTGSLAVQFEVVRGAPGACGVPLQTHAAADSTLFATTVTVVRRAGAAPAATTATRVGANPNLELRAPTTKSTVLTGGGSRTVDTAAFARLSYGLSWLAPSTRLAKASVWVYVKKAPGGTAVLLALDADAKDAAGLPSTASPLGQAALSLAGAWVEVPLDAARVAAKLAGGKPLNLALTLDAGFASPFVLLGSASKGPPPLLLTPAC